MSELKLEVERLTASVTTLDGVKEQMTFFAPVQGGVTSPISTLTDELDDPSIEFLPCRIADRTTLVRVAWIAYVELDANLPHWLKLEEVGAIANRVEIDLMHGETLAGSLMVEGSEYTRRVSDHLNRPSGRFILLRGRAAAFCVNRHAIARVRLGEVDA